MTSNRFSIKIPPRSSSLFVAPTQSLSPREETSNLDYENWRENDFANARDAWLSQSASNNRIELPLPSPPLSPVKRDTSSIFYRGTEQRRESFVMPAHQSTLSSPSGGNLIPNLISALDDSMSKLPPTSLNLETPCITSIRKYLYQSSHHVNLPWRVPALLPSPVLEGDNSQPQRYPSRSSSRGKTSYLSSFRRTLSSRSSKSTTLPEPSWNQPMPIVFHDPFAQDTEPPSWPNRARSPAFHHNLPQHNISTALNTVRTYSRLPLGLDDTTTCHAARTHSTSIPGSPSPILLHNLRVRTKEGC